MPACCPQDSKVSWDTLFSETSPRPSSCWPSFLILWLKKRGLPFYPHGEPGDSTFSPAFPFSSSSAPSSQLPSFPRCPPPELMGWGSQPRSREGTLMHTHLEAGSLAWLSPGSSRSPAASSPLLTGRAHASFPLPRNPSCLPCTVPTQITATVPPAHPPSYRSVPPHARK